ncbi:MAG: STAS domain-containing protein [Marinilabiliaceae bacterium]|nr:STAS domain-containing protein [Marinilabiliaceae bacterium]
MENFKIKYTNKKETTDVVFSGHLDVTNIEKIVDSLKTNITKGNSLNIKVKEVETLDVTFVQVIFSLVKSGKTEGYEVRTSFDIPKELEQLLVHAGLSGQLIENK